MEFAICSIRDVEEPTPDPSTEGLLFPVPTAERNSVVMEPRDGDRFAKFSSEAFSVHDVRHQRRVSEMEDVRADVIVTDARTVLACSKFAKGGGWVGLGVGGLAFAAVANSVSKVRAARRRKGRMLVGHVRHPWLASVTVRQGGFMKGKNELRLRLSAAGGDELSSLVIQVPKDVEVVSTGLAVVRRAARYRLASEPELSAEDRAGLERLAEVEAPAIAAGETRTFEFPSPHPVSLESAAIMPAQAVAS